MLRNVELLILFAVLLTNFYVAVHCQQVISPTATPTGKKLISPTGKPTVAPTGTTGKLVIGRSNSPSGKPASPSGINNSIIPKSPFGDPLKICYQNQSFSVNGYPGTPNRLLPFQDTFVNPVDAIPISKSCRTDGHCLNAYSFDVFEKQIPAFNNAVPACKAFPSTWFLTYGGSIPG